MRSILSGKTRRAALGCLLVLAAAAQASGRKWQAANSGFEFEAEVARYDGKDITFKVPGGQSFAIQVEKLSDADKQYLKQTYPDGLVDPNAKEKKDAKKPDDKPAPAEPTQPTESPAATPPPAKAAKPKVATPRVANRPVRPPAKAPSRAAGAAKPADKSGVTVEVVRLSITKPLPEELASAQTTPAGIHATLLVTDPARTISGLDPEQSKITRCIDDQRTDLTKAAGDAGGAPNTLALEVHPSGHSGTIELDLPQIPNPKAKQMLIRGELHVLCDNETVAVPLEIILSIGL